MKTKLIITSLVIITLSITFLSFRSGEKENCNIALVSSVFSKEKESNGFLISYGDGTIELKSYEFNKKLIEGVSVMAQIMNEMHAKGYRYISPASHAFNSLGHQTNYLVFEKK